MIYTTTTQAGSLLTSTQVAARLGLKNPHTLAVWRCSGRYPDLPYIKVGRLVRYRPEDLEAFIEVHSLRSEKVT